MTVVADLLIYLCRHICSRELQDIEKKYPGFIHMKLLQGIKLSHRLQEITQRGPVVRGCKIAKQGEIPTALNGFLYSIMKTTKSQRRSILNNLLKQFDDTAVRICFYCNDPQACV